RALLPQQRQQPVQSHDFTCLLKGPTQYFTAHPREHNAEHAGRLCGYGASCASCADLSPT
ncbi:MAG TPA: hypothetical protein VNA31_11355, partial [bacterium]|nr:hypothetical protein [bacterium]